MQGMPDETDPLKFILKPLTALKEIKFKKFGEFLEEKKKLKEYLIKQQFTNSVQLKRSFDP